jgi:hypothetical protein
MLYATSAGNGCSKKKLLALVATPILLRLFLSGDLLHSLQGSPLQPLFSGLFARIGKLFERFVPWLLKLLGRKKTYSCTRTIQYIVDDTPSGEKSMDHSLGGGCSNIDTTAVF